jgi:hypothetical protein
VPSMKITLSAAMRARDASRPQAEHEAAARAADLAGQAHPGPPGQPRPAPGGSRPDENGPDGSGPGPKPDGRPQPGSGRPGGPPRAGRGRGRGRRRHGH